MKEPSLCPNPKRVEAGRRNRALRRGLTDAGRERLRKAALANRPWEGSTGPRTPEGKARAADNGRSRQAGPVSVRQMKSEMRCELAEVYAIIGQMQAMRGRLAGR